MIKPLMNANRRELKNKTPELRFPEFDGEWVEKRLGKFAGFSKGHGLSEATPSCTPLDNSGIVRMFSLNNTCQAYVFGYAQIGGLLFFRGM